MAQETDQKTLTGILVARKKIVEIRGTLREIDPEHEDVATELRRTRGLAAALGRQLFRLDEVVEMVAQGRSPNQRDLSEVIRGTRVDVPSLRDEEAAAIREAAERGDYDGESEDEEPEGEPVNPGATNAVNFFAPPAIVAEKLAAVGRPLPVSFLETWKAEDRAAALRWADNRLGGGSAPAPEILGKRYLEDLDLAAPLGRVELMVWLGIALPAQVEAVRQELDVPDFAGTDWDDVRDWAIAAHRRDRGESVVVPNPIHQILPTRARIAAIKESLAEDGEASIEDLIARDFDLTPSMFLAVETLVQAAEIVRGDDGKLHAARPDLVAAEEVLTERAFDIATRGTRRAVAAPDPDAATEDAGDVSPEELAQAGEELTAGQEGEPVDVGTVEELEALPSVGDGEPAEAGE